MIPIVTPEEMAAIDAAAPEPVEVLIDRAASAVAWAATDLLGGTYGRRVVVIAGPGNNGNDGRVAAAKLRRRGVRVDVIDALADADALPPADLVIDAAFGTGLSRGYDPPDTGLTPVLAVDIASGLNGLTGEVMSGALDAVATVTFAALKPGLLLDGGIRLSGDIDVADIGLDTDTAAAHLLTEDDVAGILPERALDAHKWQCAVWVIAGSPAMAGAASLAATAAYRAGAGYVRLSSPGAGPAVGSPIEAVGMALPEDSWGGEVAPLCDRLHAVVLGPGLGTAESRMAQVRTAIAAIPLPLVVDGDGLTALGADAGSVLRERRAPTVLTPHDGEFERLAGHRPGPDRFESCRSLAAQLSAHVLLKGPTTIVAAPDGDARAIVEGDERLATAGSGDVLAGALGALLAAGLDPLDAAAAGAFLHGRTARLGSDTGLVAGDLAALLPEAATSIRGST